MQRGFSVIDKALEKLVVEADPPNDIDVVLLDMNFGPGESSGRQGLQWLERILEVDPQMVVVMITAHGSVDTVVEAMKRGATDFVSKPWQNEKVVATLSAAAASARPSSQWPV